MTELAARVVSTLVDRGVTVATAETLTGGLIGATITNVPGASQVFLGGVIAYDSRIKTELLGVPAALIARYTVVSEDVARSMAAGLQDATGADWCISVTGVAGPTGQEGHPPGEVWVCVQGPRIGSGESFQIAERYDFEGDRDAVRRQTVDAAFAMLLRVLSPV